MPQTPCGEYHVAALRLNRPRLRLLRLLRNAKQQRLAEVLALQNDIERVLPEVTEPAIAVMRRLLAFVHHEIELLQVELAVAIPFIPPQGRQETKR